MKLIFEAITENAAEISNFKEFVEHLVGEEIDFDTLSVIGTTGLNLALANSEELVHNLANTYDGSIELSFDKDTSKWVLVLDMKVKLSYYLKKAVLPFTTKRILPIEALEHMCTVFATAVSTLCSAYKLME
jgi:hypothetical protein